MSPRNPRPPALAPRFVLPYPTLVVVTLATVVLALAATPAAAQGPTYVAFGDSITFGVGDDQSREEIGYPPRLEALLLDAGEPVDEVRNEGLPGETTAEGLSRIGQVLQAGDDVLLLMEGTNDINGRVSNETIRFNLDRIALFAEQRGLEAVHATTIPRLSSANFDGNNQVTAALAGEIRDLAWVTDRRLVDPFAVYTDQPNGFEDLFVGGEDKLHPDPGGHDLLAEIFADALLGRDTVPPVTGLVAPENDAQNVDPSTPVEVDVYDFGSGIDVAATSLLINGEAVNAQVSGDERKLELRYAPPDGWVGVVFVGLRSRDLQSPPLSVDETLVQFVTRGTDFLEGDITRDGRVDGEDLVALAVRFGSVQGDNRYRLFADFNGDGFIDGVDLALLASNFGLTSF